MTVRKNPALTANSKTLRKNMTKEERHLWYDFLKLLPITVHRQKVIGPYIADFYLPCASIILELDGSQHYEDSGRERDEVRGRYFNRLGIQVLRYSNLDVNRNFTGVCEDILAHIPPEIDLGSFR